jgi:lipoprotein-anchoring transpeptidase ErfK/SrfK
MSKRRPIAAIAGVALAFGLTSCAAAPPLELRTAAVPQESQAVVSAAFLGKQDVDFTQPLEVTVAQGRLTQVSVSGPGGIPLTGEIQDGGRLWRSSEPLDLSTGYTLAATATDRYGNAAAADGAFTTMTPEEVLDYTISPGASSVVGVGMPITVRFSAAVEDKAEVERRLAVTSTAPMEGRWSWQGDKTVQFRPKTYWPANTTVTVAADLRGVESSEGVYAVEDSTQSFATGDAMIAVVNAATHQMTVTRNGAVERTVPITTGKPGWETRSGVKVVMSKTRALVMDAATLGVPKDDPDYYRLDVEYALRVTSSGEFVHAAPWSVASQGRENVSHGCVGLSMANAQWFYNAMRVGDIVEVTNTGRPQNLGNGITVWNESWDQWVSGSALPTQVA